MINEVEIFRKITGYTFKNPNLLHQALTHSSYANENKNKLQSNERLEFLGDSVLSIIISNYLYINCPKVNEGNMSKYRAYIVCEASLARVARSIDLGSYLYLGKGEDKTGGRNRNSVLSDAVEAVIAALYLDGGLKIAEGWVLQALKEIIHEAADNKTMTDYKTMLQEKYQHKGESQILYEVTAEDGPAHNKCFTVQVSLDGTVIGEGKGRNKKAAEQAAAKEAMSL